MAEIQGDLDKLCVNTIRMLAVDMVEAANSGHPGMPLGAATMAYVLWDRYLKHNPANPQWADRDRFILSAGHGSALLYALLHLTGYDLTLNDLKAFRQWESKTAGHPEYGLCPGVEATTGPLGQGFAMGVGMAAAEKHLAGRLNRPGHTIVDHYTYAIVSDGDLMEGVASEAASLAATLGLGKLIYLYDDNKISIEGGTELAFTEDVGGRFEAYGWQVLRVEEGDDVEAIMTAIDAARAETSRPSLVMVRTHIGCGSPKQDSAAAHGEPLGAEAARATRACFGWPSDPFHIPPEVLSHLRQARERGRQAEDQWQQTLAAYLQAHPEDGRQYAAWLKGQLPPGWREALPVFDPADQPLATRVASGQVINALAPVVQNLIGGSADLAPSTKTVIKGSGDLRGTGPDCGRNIHFGVREHAMGAMVNGMALHGGLIPYGATFFVFSDFMRPALRLAALMQTKSIFVFTHDSLGVGEDGPTHQPVEHLMALRVMPGFRVVRPADANETAQAWALALASDGPTALVLSRQNLPILDPRAYPIASGVAAGGYVLSEESGALKLILIATGAEVHLALDAQKVLQDRGVGARVVSLPCWEVFAQQPREYRDKVLPPACKARLAIEAGASLGWERWVGDGGAVIGVDRFGASAPGGKVLANYGFNLDNVVARAQDLLG
ncbi:MAG: transketolase [Desulfarculus sp.]|nr:transketolase [Desulfarculus sp.]